MNIKLENVFGVSSKPVLSYVERDKVDNRFNEELNYDKKIIIVDIYSSILRQADITIKSSSTESSEKEATLGLVSRFKAILPIFGSAEVEGNTELKSTDIKDYEYEEVPFNLSLPQDIGEILKKVRFNKIIILENFHYLDDELQKEFAYDLRSFQELGIRFIILGVWREKNKMVQFNGDLLDRIVEVPVEPWHREDFVRVTQQGAEKLSIIFPQDLLEKCHQVSFSSIGVLQEILKEICISANILEKQNNLISISLYPHLENAVKKKAEDYSVRHQRALEAIASGNSSASIQGDLLPLFLPYYLVKVILESGYEGLANGMNRSILQNKIQDVHHRPNDVRASDMSNLLYSLAKLQSNKNISPPIIDFDRNTKSLQIVDSTFYFFLQNADLSEILKELPSPLDK